MYRGVLVGGARVGIGACVGVAWRVLPGSTSGGGAVGGAKVGRITAVGIATTTVSGGGVVTSVGRAT